MDLGRRVRDLASVHLSARFKNLLQSYQSGKECQCSLNGTPDKLNFCVRRGRASQVEERKHLRLRAAVECGSAGCQGAWAVHTFFFPAEICTWLAIMLLPKSAMVVIALSISKHPISRVGFGVLNRH